MRANPAWRGVRMRTGEVAPDPDSPSRQVTLPASWEDEAAAGLAALLPGSGPAFLTEAAEAWIGPLGWQARQRGLATDLDERLRDLLLRRLAAPSRPLWAGTITDEPPRLVLALSGFHDPHAGLDVPALEAATDTLAVALRLLPAEATLCPAGLDGLLAALGLDYDSQAARDVAACLMALLRGRLQAALADTSGVPPAPSVRQRQPDLLAASPAWPEPPSCVVPGLTEAARAAWDAGRARSHPGGTPHEGGREAGGRDAGRGIALAPAGPAEALLGVEAGGIAPAFAPVTASGRLSRATQARLAASGRSPEAALAALLSGESLFRPASPAAHAAMAAAVAPFLNVPAATGPFLQSGPAPARHVPLPDHHAGLTRRALLGGHRIYLRTAEYADGSLGELAVTLPREGAAFRGLTEAFAQAVSLGLQHGVPLEAFVEAFALTRFGPAGAVEGDPAVTRATSVPDYVVRALAAQYLGRTVPEPEAEEPEPDLPLPLLRLVR
ncbi:MAG: hypothetical protein ACRYHQ_20245 [Janthinobacterium lividum]